jgi:aspergillopepsin I
MISSVRPTSQPSFFETISKSLDWPIIGMALNHDRNGYLDFGYVNDTRHDGSLSWSYVDNTQGRWEIHIDHSFYVGSQIYSNGSWAAYVDSGSSIMTVPKFAYDAWVAQVPGAIETSGELIPNVHGLIFPCTTVLPSFGILLGNYTATVPGSALKGQVINDVHCYCGLQMADPSTPVLGAPFMESQYAVFNWNGPMLGLAPQAGL